ncbi:hypothetical protein [Microbacterium hydrocarbonoxydans]|nr:hypothetical protein [Microbacterium hydrocarbonoxydans]
MTGTVIDTCPVIWERSPSGLRARPGAGEQQVEGEVAAQLIDRAQVGTGD